MTGAFSQAFNNEITEEQLRASAKLKFSVGKLTGQLSADGDLAGKIDFTEDFSVSLDSNGSGTVSQGIYSANFDGVDISSLEIGKDFRALNVSVALTSEGNISFVGSLDVTKLVKVPYLKLTFEYSHTIDVSSAFLNNSGLLGNAARGLKSRNIKDMCAKYDC